MDANILVNIISNVGFPIAVCVALYYMNTNSIKKLEDIVNKNTEVLEKLLKQLEG